jgi:hypothetical protein
LFDYRIEGVAARALDSQKMPVSSMTFRFAIVAHDIHNTLQISRHGVLSNISGTGFPSSCHTLLTDYRLFANGASIIKASQFSKAVRMNGMATWKILWRLARREHVFPADGAIVFVLVFEALMSIKDAD